VGVQRTGLRQAEPGANGWPRQEFHVNATFDRGESDHRLEGNPRQQLLIARLFRLAFLGLQQGDLFGLELLKQAADVVTGPQELLACLVLAATSSRGTPKSSTTPLLVTAMYACRGVQLKPTTRIRAG
jgi:hypothetical protein